MKKRKQKRVDSLSKKISNRLSYTIIAFVGLMLVGVFVFASTPNPGHDYTQLDLGPVKISGGEVNIGTTLNVIGSSSYAIHGSGKSVGVYGSSAGTGIKGVGGG